MNLQQMRYMAAIADYGTMTGLGTFAETMTCHESSIVKVETSVPDEQLALIGCGITTGVGAALNTMLAHVETSLEARHRSEQQVRQFVADASHELRTPLTTIAGYTELARRRPEDENVRAALGKVEEESVRMTSLVEDMLLLARLDDGRPLDREPVDLTRLLVEAVDDSEPELTTLKLSCIADDAQGEQIEVIWDAEIGTSVIEDNSWAQVGRGAPDDERQHATAPGRAADPARRTGRGARPDRRAHGRHTRSDQ